MIDIDWDMYPRAAKKHQRADWLSAAVYTIMLGSAYNKEDNKMEERKNSMLTFNEKDFVDILTFRHMLMTYFFNSYSNIDYKPNFQYVISDYAPSKLTCALQKVAHNVGVKYEDLRCLTDDKMDRPLIIVTLYKDIQSKRNEGFYFTSAVTIANIKKDKIKTDQHRYGILHMADTLENIVYNILPKRPMELNPYLLCHSCNNCDGCFEYEDSDEGINYCSAYELYTTSDGEEMSSNTKYMCNIFHRMNMAFYNFAKIDKEINNISIIKEDNKMEEKNVTEAKDTKGKTRLDLVLPSAIEWLGRIRTYGVQKYKDPDNWKKVPKEQYIAAAMRHFEKYRAGSYFDEESGMPHLAHAMCNLMFLLDMEDDERTAKCDGSWCNTCDGSCGSMCKNYSANEFRRILGMKSLDDPEAEELKNKNLSDTCDGSCGCKDDDTNKTGNHGLADPSYHHFRICEHCAHHRPDGTCEIPLDKRATNSFPTVNEAFNCVLFTPSESIDIPKVESYHDDEAYSKPMKAESICKYCNKCIHYYSSFDVVYNKYNKRCSLRIDTSSHLLKDDGTCDCFSARDDLYLPEELKHCSEI